MAVSLLTRWLEHYDPIHRGWTPAGIANAACTRAGFAFGRIAGGYNLMRSEGTAPSVADAIEVGATSPTAATPTEIKNFPTYPFPASSTCWCWVRALSPGGAADVASVQAVRIDTDGAGDPETLTPNPPYRLSARAVADGKIRLTWEHNAAGEQIRPFQWNIYHDDGGGTIDYETPLATIKGRTYLTAAYSHDTTVQFAVRAESRDGAEEQNTDSVSATAVADGPDDLPAPTLTAGDEE